MTDLSNKYVRSFATLEEALAYFESAFRKDLNQFAKLIYKIVGLLSPEIDEQTIVANSMMDQSLFNYTKWIFASLNDLFAAFGLNKDSEEYDNFETKLYGIYDDILSKTPLFKIRELAHSWSRDNMENAEKIILLKKVRWEKKE